MFNSGILDVAIGIVFVYLLVSLMVTAVSELFAALLKYRGRVLWRGLQHLLPVANGQSLAKQVYDHPLIAGLSRANRPSYIPSRTFALALLDVVSGSTRRIAKGKHLQARINLLPDELRLPLSLLLDEAADDFAHFQASLEVWFNDALERTSGVYKRHVQCALFALGFLLAVLLNVDTIVLANRLSHDAALRAALVANAEAAAKLPPPATTTDENASVTQRTGALRDTIAQLDQLRLPIGWGGPATDLDLSSPFQHFGFADGILDALRRHILGWVLTALAATLGAPFWFDLLNRFINIRSAGKAPEEKPKDPKKVPLPVAPGEHLEAIEADPPEELNP
ncbi:MAG: hypothetical protein ACR2MW_00470 [Chthoniobacterales bacterium]